MKIHLKGLTEIRGIAVLIVLISHIDQFHKLLNNPSLGIHKTTFASHSVTIFFTLSGFLITYLLLIEKEKHKTIRVKHFYIRRMLRIWPAYYLTILLSLGLMAIGFFNFPTANKLILACIGYVFMMPNVLYTLGLTFAATSQLWSIGVEEQFYLFWPILVKKASHLKNVILLLVISYVIIKISLFVSIPQSGVYALLNLTRIDCMAIGAMFALINKEYTQYNHFVFHPISQLVALTILLSFGFLNTLFANIDTEIYSIASAVWISNTALNQKSFIAVKSKILHWIGEISYGIYVYHFIIIYIFGRTIVLQQNSISSYFLIIFFTATLSYLSFKYFETPFLNLKDRFSVVKSRI